MPLFPKQESTELNSPAISVLAQNSFDNMHNFSQGNTAFNIIKSKIIMDHNSVTRVGTDYNTVGNKAANKNAAGILDASEVDKDYSLK